MKIFVTGTRGIPDIPGGVEKHCQQLYPHIVAQGHEVFLSTRSCYIDQKRSSWKGIRLVHTYAPRKKSLEAIVHTFNALVAARKYRPDVVHIHAVGPSLLTPLARLMGFKVVVTNHGPDYHREKWGKLAKVVLRTGERFGNIFSHQVIAISHVIASIIRDKDNREPHVIYNGVSIQETSDASDYLARQGIIPRRYVLSVARLVPEKGLHDLVAAFERLPSAAGYQLVIAGDADHETPYSRGLKRSAGSNDRIFLTGYITGEALNQVYSHASLFVLPSYHEGLPIALLEAMSFGIPTLVSDIPAHLEVGLSSERYFSRGNVADLAEKLEFLLRQDFDDSEKETLQREIREKYDWRKIAAQTVSVYRKAIGPSSDPSSR